MSLQFADTVILGEICYDMKLCTQWKKKTNTRSTQL